MIKMVQFSKLNGIVDTHVSVICYWERFSNSDCFYEKKNQGLVNKPNYKPDIQVVRTVGNQTDRKYALVRTAGWISMFYLIFSISYTLIGVLSLGIDNGNIKVTFCHKLRL